MFLSRIKVENYRNIESIDVSLQPGLTVLVGRNNVGKSNLLAAVRNCLGPSASLGEPSWLSKDDFLVAARGVAPTAVLRVSIYFSGLSEGHTAQFFEILDVDKGDIRLSRAAVHIEASWRPERNRVSLQRWGGSPTGERTPIPEEILQSLPITYLPALRDAQVALSPGNRSRLAGVLAERAQGREGSDAVEIQRIFEDANAKLEATPLIANVAESIRKRASQMAGTDYLKCAVRASPPTFDRVLRTLQLTLDDGPVPDIGSTGHGYQNLLFVATVLAHLEGSSPDDMPLLLVEEPEAHLHPQLALLLAEHLAGQPRKREAPQTIVTTHSPTLAAHVRPTQVVVMSKTASRVRCNAIRDAGLSEEEERRVQRMLDVTRAAMYFAKGLILVEGISEALLVPVLAKRIGVDLRDKHVSVLPICGVAFGTLRKILTETALNIPTAILSDADPIIEEPSGWDSAVPQMVDSKIVPSERATALRTAFAGAPSVIVAISEITLEFDLAKADERNALRMARVWEQCFEGTPRTLNVSKLEAISGASERALAVWRGICRANPSKGKAEFAQLLADDLLEKEAEAFAVPEYIQSAVAFVDARLRY